MLYGLHWHILAYYQWMCICICGYIYIAIIVMMMQLDKSGSIFLASSNDLSLSLSILCVYTIYTCIWGSISCIDIHRITIDDASNQFGGYLPLVSIGRFKRAGSFPPWHDECMIHWWCDRWLLEARAPNKTLLNKPLVGWSQRPWVEFPWKILSGDLETSWIRIPVCHHFQEEHIHEFRLYQPWGLCAYHTFQNFSTSSKSPAVCLEIGILACCSGRGLHSRECACQRKQDGVHCVPNRKNHDVRAHQPAIICNQNPSLVTSEWIVDHNLG